MLDITPTQDRLVFPSLDMLELDIRNARKSHPESDIRALADSIRHVGLIQNLAGLELPSGKIGIVAGGRRLAALNLLHAEGHPVGPVPVILADTLEEAMKWTFAENDARTDLSPVEQIRAYRTLAKEGMSVQQIAASFAVTENLVQRRLKLASLPEAVIEAVETNRITLDVAAALTLAKDEAKALEVLDDVMDRGVPAWRVRDTLKQSGVSAKSRLARFVGEEDYLAAGGTITRDLFSDDVIFDDADILNSLAGEKLRLAAEDAMETGGWLWSDVSDAPDDYQIASDLKLQRIYRPYCDLSDSDHERMAELEEKADEEALTDEEMAEYEALDNPPRPDFTDAQKSVGGVIAYVRYDGSLEFSAAYIRQEDMDAARKAGVIEDRKATPGTCGDDGGEPVEKGFSGALTADLHAIELRAMQAALVEDAERVFQLIAFHLAGPFNTTGLELSRHTPTNEPTKTSGLNAVEKLDAEFKGSFNDFRALSREDITKLFCAGIARQFGNMTKGRPDGIYDLFADELAVRMRSVWTPDKENFFGRVTSGQLTDIMAELMGWSETSAERAEFGRLKKGAKAEILEKMFATEGSDVEGYMLTDDIKARIAVWEPSIPAR